MQCKACKTSAAHAVRPWHGMPGRRARDSNNGDDVEMMRWWLPESLAARAFLVLKFFLYKDKDGGRALFWERDSPSFWRG
jgi:hypothetical protein